MDNREKNVIDKFLEGYEAANENNTIYKRVYVRPSKFKSIIGFVFSLLLVIILIRMFVLKLMYFVIFIPVLIICSYYGINLFTKKGFALPKTIIVDKNNDENVQEE